MLFRELGSLGPFQLQLTRVTFVRLIKNFYRPVKRLGKIIGHLFHCEMQLEHVTGFYGVVRQFIETRTEVYRERTERPRVTVISFDVDS